MAVDPHVAHCSPFLCGPDPAGSLECSQLVLPWSLPSPSSLAPKRRVAPKVGAVDWGVDDPLNGPLFSQLLTPTAPTAPPLALPVCLQLLHGGK